MVDFYGIDVDTVNPPCVPWKSLMEIRSWNGGRRMGTTTSDGATCNWPAGVTRKGWRPLLPGWESFPGHV